MRLRNIKGSREAIAANPFVVSDPAQHRGHWAELFDGQRPLAIEVGMGKGQFLMETARRHPEFSFLGIEKYSSVLIRALQKQEEQRLPNVLFLRMEAELLPEVFAPGEVALIYLNFSDPWPKARHANRRLTSGRFLDRYRQILSNEGRIECKTDNAAFFAFSREAYRQAGWRELYVTQDLHQSPLAADNVMTEYEEKFSALGNPIYKFCIAPPEQTAHADTAKGDDIALP